MTVTECCWVFITVAFVAASASIIHAHELQNKLNRYTLARWRREERGEGKKASE